MGYSSVRLIQPLELPPLPPAAFSERDAILAHFDLLDMQAPWYVSLQDPKTSDDAVQVPGYFKQYRDTRALTHLKALVEADLLTPYLAPGTRPLLGVFTDFYEADIFVDRPAIYSGKLLEVGRLVIVVLTTLETLDEIALLNRDLGDRIRLLLTGQTEEPPGAGRYHLPYLVVSSVVPLVALL